MPAVFFPARAIDRDAGGENSLVIGREAGDELDLSAGRAGAGDTAVEEQAIARLKVKLERLHV